MAKRPAPRTLRRRAPTLFAPLADGLPSDEPENAFSRSAERSQQAARAHGAAGYVDMRGVGIVAWATARLPEIR